MENKKFDVVRLAAEADLTGDEVDRLKNVLAESYQNTAEREVKKIVAERNAAELLRLAEIPPRKQTPGTRARRKELQRLMKGND